MTSGNSIKYNLIFGYVSKGNRYSCKCYLELTANFRIGRGLF